MECETYASNDNLVRLVLHWTGLLGEKVTDTSQLVHLSKLQVEHPSFTWGLLARYTDKSSKRPIVKDATAETFAKLYLQPTKSLTWDLLRYGVTYGVAWRELVWCGGVPCVPANRGLFVL